MAYLGGGLRSSSALLLSYVFVTRIRGMERGHSSRQGLQNFNPPLMHIDNHDEVT